jgi:AraC-like DNA-binding protein
MHKASGLLRRGNATIASVARAVGYENESSFGKVFQRYTGQPPGEFRARSNGAVVEGHRDDGPGDPAPVGSLAAMR